MSKENKEINLGKRLLDFDVRNMLSAARNKTS